MQQLKHQFALLLLASFGLALAPTLALGDIQGFGDFSGFQINKSDSNSAPTLFPGTPGTIAGKIELTGDVTNEGRSIFYNTPQPVSKFTASFTYQAVDNHADGSVGVAFVIQNSPTGAHAIAPFGGTGPLLGYGGITPSLAVTLELQASSASGLFTGGILGGGSPHTAPVNLLSGDPINVTLAYNGGSTLLETIVDGGASYSTTFSLPNNLSTIIGNSTAFVGFTAGAYDFQFDQQYISNFQYITPEPSSLALAGVAAVGLFASIRRRHRT